MSRQIRVLFVEDSEDDTLLILRALRKAGYDPVHQRVEMDEAMRQCLADGTWDVVLADYKLPRFSGMAALRLVQSTGIDVPFIVVSGTIGEETAVDLMKAGAHDFVMKNNLARLPQAIERERQEVYIRAERRQNAEALFESEKRLRAQVARQEALLEINRSIQEMTEPADLERVARVCFEQLTQVGLPFCSLAIQRVVDETAGSLAFYEIQPSGAFHSFVGESPNLFRIWRAGKTLYRSDLDADMGGLDPVARDRMSQRYGRRVQSILNVCHALGVLSVLSDVADPFSEDDIRFFEQVAQALSVGMRRLDDMENLDSVVCHLSEGVCLLNSARRLVFANAMGYALIKDLAVPAPGDVVSLIQGHNLEEIQRVSQNMPFEVQLPDERIVEIVVNPVREGVVHRGWVLVCRDVTQEREVQEKIAQQERLATVGQLVAGIAHDFNNMLTIMTGFAQLLEMRTDVPEAVKGDLVEIFHQGQRGAQLIRQMLDFSRSSKVEKQVIDLVPFVKESAKLLGRTLSEAISLNIDVGRESLTVKANLTQLQQVLTNLALNSRDAMPGGGMLTIQLRRIFLEKEGVPPVAGMTPGSWVVLNVSDTGSGMSPEVMARVFEPFFTTKKRGEGTGLGLAQVYGIVKQHDGFIGAKSREGHGTTFSIFLPEEVAGVAAPLVSGVPAQGNGETILVAEDEVLVLRSLKQMLEHLGYKIIAARNGQEAVAAFEANAGVIDGLLLDLVMPGMSGLDVIERLQSRGLCPPAVIMTGYLAEAQRLADRIQHVAGFVEKPLDLYGIADVLQKMLSTPSP